MVKQRGAEHLSPQDSYEARYQLLETRFSFISTPSQLYAFLKPGEHNLFIPDEKETNTQKRLYLPLIYISPQYRERVEQTAENINNYPELKRTQLDDIIFSGNIPTLFFQADKVIESSTGLSEKKQFQALQKVFERIDDSIAHINTHREHFDTQEWKRIRTLDEKMRTQLHAIQSVLYQLRNFNTAPQDEDPRTPPSSNHVGNTAVTTMLMGKSPEENSEKKRQEYIQTLTTALESIPQILLEIRSLAEKSDDIILQEKLALMNSLGEKITEFLKKLFNILDALKVKQQSFISLEGVILDIETLYAHLAHLHLDNDPLEVCQDLIQDTIIFLNQYLWFESVEKTLPHWQHRELIQLEERITAIREEDNKDIAALLKEAGMSDEDIAEWTQRKMKS